MLRNGAVRSALEQFRPDLIECQDAYNLPWAAIAHRRRYPGTALVAAYMTDFPTVYVERPFSKFLGRPARQRVQARICYAYCGMLYRRFDARLRAQRERRRHQACDRSASHDVDVVPLGVEVGEFGPIAARSALRAQARPCRRPAAADLCRPARRREEAGRGGRCLPRFPEALGAKLALIGEGPLKAGHRGARRPAHRHARLCEATAPNSRAGWRAPTSMSRAWPTRPSAFRSSKRRRPALPVVGVAAGAMIDRVTDAIGRLGPGRRCRRDGRAISSTSGTATAPRWREAARAHALQFSWDSSMEALFGRVYPAAFRRARPSAQVDVRHRRLSCRRSLA